MSSRSVSNLASLNRGDSTYGFVSCPKTQVTLTLAFKKIKDFKILEAYKNLVTISNSGRTRHIWERSFKNSYTNPSTPFYKETMYGFQPNFKIRKSSPKN